MIGALVVFLMILLFYGFAFGITRLLLRHSAWDSYSLEAPFLTGPALIVLALSLLGWTLLSEVPHLLAWILFGAGWALSAIMLYWDRRQILALLRDKKTRLATVLVPACVAATMVLLYSPGNAWDSFLVLCNDEYLNYAELTAYLTGHHQGAPGDVSMSVQSHRIQRNGQDLVAAEVAQVTGLHPLRVIWPLAVLFRFQNSVALGLLICSLAGNGSNYRLALLVLLLDAVVFFETMAFSISFFSANCAMPLYMLYLALVAAQPRFGWRETAMLVLLNLFFLLVYPEWLAVVKAVEALVIITALVTSNRRRFLPLLATNVIVMAMHPFLICEKGHWIVHQATSGAGWNVMGSLVHQPALYLRCCFGMGAPWISCEPVSWILCGVVVLAALTVTGLGMVLLLRQRHLTLPVLAWLALLVAGHVQSIVNHGDNWYVAFKILSMTYFLFFVAAAAMLFVSRPRWRFVAVVLVGVWLTGAAYAAQRLIPSVRQQGVAIDHVALCNAMRAAPKGCTIASVSRLTRMPVLLELISGATGATVVPLTPLQERLLTSNWRGAGKVGRLGPMLERCPYEGLLVADGDPPNNGLVFVDDLVLYFECQEVLTRLGSVSLCRGRLLLPSDIAFPPGTRIRQGYSKVCVLARTTQLRITGELTPPQHVPYHFVCAVEALGWSQEIELTHDGEFAVNLALPASACGQVITLEFKDFPTFCPAESLPGSLDQRHVAFLVKQLEFLPTQHHSGAVGKP
jgi:hypothetical protein